MLSRVDTVCTYFSYLELVKQQDTGHLKRRYEIRGKLFFCCVKLGVSEIYENYVILLNAIRN